MRVQRPGRRAAWVAVRGAYGGGVIGALGVAGYGVLRAEAALARHTIGEPTGETFLADGVYGRHRGRRLRLVLLGDSSAVGLGCAAADQTPGALLAGGIARDLRRPVEVQVLAVVGARSADLDVQVAQSLQQPVDLAVIMIGANDVTHRVPPAEAARDLGRAVRALRAAGALVVVGTCPDLGTVKPLLQPLRSAAQLWSRRLAAAQAVAVVEDDGIAVSLGSLLSPEFASSPHLWSSDRFHPSPAGYLRLSDALLPSLLEASGVQVPVSVPVSTTVQDVSLAAAAAAREPGVVLETVPGQEGIASSGPGRLTRLVRRLPLVGRGAPDARIPTDDDGLEPGSTPLVQPGGSASASGDSPVGAAGPGV